MKGFRFNTILGILAGLLVVLFVYHGDYMELIGRQYSDIAWIQTRRHQHISSSPYQQITLNNSVVDITHSLSLVSHIEHPGRRNDLNVKFDSYFAALKNRASTPGRDVFLMYADLGVYGMAVSFYKLSLLRHGIDNYLFLTSSSEMCGHFQQMQIACFQYTNISSSSKGSRFGSKDFKAKMNIRTFMILEALQQGYNVLHSDCDIYFYANPLPTVRRLCGSECDVAPLWDYRTHNAGFVYTRSTTLGIAMYTHMKRTALDTRKSDQIALNAAIEVGITDGLKVVSLPEEQFQSGRKFFRDSKHMFPGDKCDECLVMHNNWIISIAAKEYRFKEMHMWMYDGDEYYSSMSRKYLVYNNTNNHMSDMEALSNALAIGQLLNRTVVLPKFKCGRKFDQGISCVYTTNCKMKEFDARFHQQYREHTFLTHPLVPKAVKESQSKVILIKTNSSPESAGADLVFNPSNANDGATSNEIVQWLSNRTEPVLRFHSLYNAFWKFADPATNKEFIQRTNEAYGLKCKE